MVPSIPQALLFFVLSSSAHAQLSGPVGPLTSYTAKANTKICDVTDYGAAADSKTDLGPPLSAAWDACKDGGLVYIPAGTYAMQTWVSLNGGNASAIQLDGTIFRDGDDGGNMISVNHCTDFELFSGNSEGALQGYGYKLLQNGKYGARFLRLTDVENFSVHGIALVDSASYYTVFDSCTNGEIYNIIIRGIDIGATDGVDVWGENLWVHDVEVTNGDECVTVKSPAKNILIESIHCNISGGTAIGSLGANTNISNIYYRNLYMNQADACYLKSNGGSGTVNSIVWDTNWRGYNTKNGRPTIRLECDNDVPCYDITVEDVNLWTEEGDYVTWSCQSAYGEGACLHDTGDTDNLSTYSTKQTITATP
ncbi:Rhamnogalacturonase b protein [Neofusicoccum parvum]|nr:Rhamnogalacturonase b protein [Neofusicoccum parvum]